MRFLRLRLADYRGVDRCEVQFGPNGLTLIEGPNEAGKSSLAEAIGLLFDCYDSSKHRDVLAIRPVDRDVGPEIELEAQSGPYQFRYFKRFHKKPETTLAITRPTPENHTGREAHERAAAILVETIDVTLWKALILQQGHAVGQADLSGQTSLSAALDVASGRPAADPQEESLFDKVQEEYGRYFTPQGSEKKEIQQARQDQAKQEADVAALMARLRDLEKDIDRAAHLHQERGRLTKQESDLSADCATHTRALAEIQELEGTIETARLKLESAKKSEQAAQRDREERQTLIQSVAKAGKALCILNETRDASGVAAEKIEGEFKRAEDEAEQSEQRQREAEARSNLCRADFDYHNNRLHLEQLTERKTRIDRAREKAAQAEALLTKNTVDERALKKIQDAERALQTAQAQFELGAPSLRLHGLRALTVQIDDQEIALQSDEERILSVSDRVRLKIPGLLAVEVTAGTSTGDLSKKVEEARLALDAACRKAGVGSPDEARAACDSRKAAQRDVQDKNQVEADNLRDLSYDEMAKKITGLGISVPSYPSERAERAYGIGKPALAPDLASAKKENTAAEGTWKMANREWEMARKALDAARRLRDEQKEKHQKTRIDLDHQAADLKQSETSLARARSAVSDDNVEGTLAAATQEVADKQAAATSVEATLAMRRPDVVRTLEKTARESLETVRVKRTASESEATDVRARLAAHGEEGLHEQLQSAQGRLLDRQRENAATQRRAAAARLLLTTLREERDKMRRAYVAPLKERIEQLGRLVFNDSFQVAVGEDLSMTQRTLDGMTVPFESLSGGTKEQLSLLARIACAMIVAKEGGAPLILDDALGYTDPERLKGMGAVLARAGEACQIIILTCVPERYSHVGRPTVVRLK